MRLTPRLLYTPSTGAEIAGLAVAKGELRVTNDDLVAAASWNWSPISSQEIFDRTGILERRYTDRSLDDIATDAARDALENASKEITPVGAVLVCSATNTQPGPALATRIADRLGLRTLVGAWDIVAACAGFPYGLYQAVRIVEDAGCAVLVVLAEKFSDKLGTIRNSRMLFGDGAAAMLVAPTSRGQQGDVHLIQTYAGGSHREVFAVVMPNAEFGGGLTVDGSAAREIVERYFTQILRDLSRSGWGQESSGVAGADLLIPHQANERMVRDVALEAGVPSDRLYFNIARVGNLSAASIPVAIYDAVVEGIATADTRVLTPAFGAGAVAGVALVSINERLVNTILARRAQPEERQPRPGPTATG